MTSIGGEAFAECTRLTSVTIGNSVTNIGSFNGDLRICDIYVNSSTPPHIANADYFVPEYVYISAVVHIPVGSLDAYSSANGWSRFLNYKEDMTEAIEDIPEDGSTPAKVHTKGNSIVVNGTKNLENIRVYSMDGKLVDSRQGDGEISLTKGGIYIVKVGEESFKVSHY